MNIHFTKCTVNDVIDLQEISRETFFNTFYAAEFQHINKLEDVELYMSKAYDLNQLTKELKNDSSFFYFLYVDHQIAGYLKLNVADAQTESVVPDALEIERIYIRKSFQGKGLGKLLIMKSTEVAKKEGKNHVWLGVWELNESAIGFYKKMGFTQNGSHTFQFGDDEQTDFILVKVLD